jgi:hypothetical protein
VLLPRATVREDGDAEMEKPGEPTELTTRVTVVEWVRLGLLLVPVMVTV